jgi:hypothetical protein
VLIGSAPMPGTDARTANRQTQASAPLTASCHFVHRLKLHLLDFGEPLPLPGYQVINFLVKMPDFEFGFKVDAIVALRSQAILHLASGSS